MSDVVKYQPQELTISEQVRYAELVTQGDMIPQAYRNKPANALIAIGLGQAMGLSPAESLYRIDVIQGKPTAAAELIASNVRKAGHLLRVRGDDSSCSAQIVRNDDPEYTFEVVRDMAWAQRMGLNNKDNYKKQPGTMLQWRAVTAVARLACPEALYGVSYTPDEMTDLGERSRPSSNVPAAQQSATSRLAAAAQTAAPEPAPADDAPAPAEPATEPLCSRAQQTALGNALKALGHTTKDDMLGVVTEWVGRDISGSKDLTVGEAKQLTDELLATAAERDQPAEDAVDADGVLPEPTIDPDADAAWLAGN